MTLILHLYSKADEKKPSKSCEKDKSSEMCRKKLGPGAKSKMKAEFSVSTLPRNRPSKKM